MDKLTPHERDIIIKTKHSIKGLNNSKEKRENLKKVITASLIINLITVSTIITLLRLISTRVTDNMYFFYCFLNFFLIYS